VCESGGKSWSGDPRRQACGDPAAAIVVAEQRICPKRR
jgi:hypothetical protein